MPLSELEFGSYLTYTPRGDSDSAKRSQNAMVNLKQERSVGNPSKVMSQFVAEKIKCDINALPFNNFFGPNVSLIPVPKSSLMKANTLWVPKEIAKALSQQELGVYFPYLKRITPVAKAAFSNNTDRPKIMDHYDSIGFETLLSIPTAIVLIDDVITTGSTLLGCARRLKQVFPEIPIKAFAVIRTISNPVDFEKIENPCVGKIINNGYRTYRDP